METQVPLIAPTPTPVAPPVGQSIPTPPIANTFRKSNLIKIVSVILILLSLPTLFRSLFYMRSFSFINPFNYIYFFVPIIPCLVVLFTKNRTAYKIAKIFVIVSVIAPLLLGGFLIFLFIR